MRRALHALLIKRGQGTARSSLPCGQLLPYLRGTLGSASQQQCNISCSPHVCAVGSNAIDIFDRKLKQAHRDRAARLQDSNDPLLVSTACKGSAVCMSPAGLPAGTPCCGMHAWLLILVADPSALQVSVTEQLLDRLEDVKRTFPTAVILGGAGKPCCPCQAAHIRSAAVSAMH